MIVRGGIGFLTCFCLANLLEVFEGCRYDKIMYMYIERDVVKRLNLEMMKNGVGGEGYICHVSSDGRSYVVGRINFNMYGAVTQHKYDNRH